MILQLRNLLLAVAGASFIASGAHALTGPSAERVRSGVDPASIQYLKSDGLVSTVAFRMATNGRPVRIRLSATDTWHTCSIADQDVRCAVAPRPVTAIHRLEIQSL